MDDPKVESEEEAEVGVWKKSKKGEGAQGKCERG